MSCRCTCHRSPLEAYHWLYTDPVCDRTARVVTQFCWLFWRSCLGGHIWEGMLSPPGRWLSPCVLRVSGSCPVMAFMSPKTSSSPWVGLLRWPYYHHTGDHELRVMKAVKLLTAWYWALYCPSNYSDVNANVIENLIKHFTRAHWAHVAQHSVGYAIARVMANIKKRRIPSAFYRLGLLYFYFSTFLILTHIAYLYNRSIAYLAGMKMNLHSLFKCMYFFTLPLFRDRWLIMVHSNSKQMSHIYYLVFSDGWQY
jgi:hypothetical protein